MGGGGRGGGSNHYNIIIHKILIRDYIIIIFVGLQFRDEVHSILGHSSLAEQHEEVLDECSG